MALTHVTSIFIHNRRTLKDVDLPADNVQISPKEPRGLEDARVNINQIHGQLSEEQQFFL